MLNFCHIVITHRPSLKTAGLISDAFYVPFWKGNQSQLAINCFVLISNRFWQIFVPIFPISHCQKSQLCPSCLNLVKRETFKSIFLGSVSSLSKWGNDDVFKIIKLVFMFSLNGRGCYQFQGSLTGGSSVALQWE